MASRHERVSALQGLCVSHCCMMTSSNGNIFYFTGPFCGEFTGHRWITLYPPPPPLNFIGSRYERETSEKRHVNISNNENKWPIYWVSHTIPCPNRPVLVFFILLVFGPPYTHSGHILFNCFTISYYIVHRQPKVSKIRCYGDTTLSSWSTLYKDGKVSSGASWDPFPKRF